MNSLASSWFLENFQIAMLRAGGAEWAPGGPAGLLWWLMSSVMGIFSFSAALYGLTGLWIHEPLPDRMKRLLPASSQARTSGSMASLKSSLYHSMTWAVLSELMAGVFPSASITLAPYDHETDQKGGGGLERGVWGSPHGAPRF